MIALLIRLVILAAIIYIIYLTICYLTNSRRKLEGAQVKREFYFFDDSHNAQQNFFITYKGALFEGEKYLGATKYSLEVVTIFIDIVDDLQLQGFTRDDFLYLEQEIQQKYPQATISWKSTIEQLLKG